MWLALLEQQTLAVVGAVRQMLLLITAALAQSS
jgi:hypothetical protein